MKLTATYVWTHRVAAEVPDDATEEQQREALDKEAMRADLDKEHPILHECSNPWLVD